jgi:hypothetical protein
MIQTSRVVGTTQNPICCGTDWRKIEGAVIIEAKTENISVVQLCTIPVELPVCWLLYRRQPYHTTVTYSMEQGHS